MGHGNRRARLAAEILSMLSGGFSQGPTFTATEIAKILGRNVASVSGALKRMVTKGDVIRAKGHGPRGGYGYRRPALIDETAKLMSEQIAREIDRQVLDTFAYTARWTAAVV